MLIKAKQLTFITKSSTALYFSISWFYLNMVLKVLNTAENFKTESRIWRTPIPSQSPKIPPKFDIMDEKEAVGKNDSVTVTTGLNLISIKFVVFVACRETILPWT